MRIDTQQRFNMWFFISQCIGGLTIPLLILLSIYPFYLSLQLSLLLSVIFVINLVYRALVGLSYFAVYQENQTITFRYINTAFFKSKRRQIVIPCNQLTLLQIKPSLGGFRTDLLIEQDSHNGIARYPLLNVSLLTDSERKLLSQIKTRTK